MDITKLKGIGDGTAKKFEKNGITTVEQLFVIPPPKVAEMLGIDNTSAMELFKNTPITINKKADFIGIAVASKSLLDHDILSLISNSDVIVYCVLEGEFLIK